MGGCTNCVRIAFFCFNVIFWLLGVLALGIGIYSRIETDSWKDLLNSETIFEASNLLIIAGGIVSVTGFLGCLGALKKYQWLLAVYAFVVVCVLAIEVVAGVYVYMKSDLMENQLTAGLTNGIHINYGNTDTASKALTKAIDWFQENVKCCGVEGPGDWKNSDWRLRTLTGETVPRSCCRDEVTNCNMNVGVNSTNIYNNGCLTEGKSYAKDNIWLLATVAVAVGAVQVIGVIVSLCLCKSFRDENRVRDM